MRIRSLAVLTAAAVAVLGACGDDDSPPPRGEAVRVVGTEMAFTPDDVAVPAGRHEVVFVNDGAVYHELAVVSSEGAVLGARSIPAGQTAKFDVDLDKAGRYRLVCREPGHTEAGMVGALTVTP